MLYINLLHRRDFLNWVRRRLIFLFFRIFRCFGCPVLGGRGCCMSYFGCLSLLLCGSTRGLGFGGGACTSLSFRGNGLLLIGMRLRNFLGFAFFRPRGSDFKQRCSNIHLSQYQCTYVETLQFLEVVKKCDERTTCDLWTAWKMQLF